MIELLATMFVFTGNNVSGKNTIRNLRTQNFNKQNNLLEHLVLINQLIVIDNSGAGGEIVLEADWTQIKHYTTKLPGCAQLIQRELKTRNNLKR